MKIEPIETSRLVLRGFTPEDGVYNIAYCVSKEHWRKGNAASIAIAEKLGCRVASERPCRKKDRELTEYHYEADL